MAEWLIILLLIGLSLNIYLLVLAKKLVAAVERIAENVEIGVDAWTESLEQQSEESSQELPPTENGEPTA